MCARWEGEDNISFSVNVLLAYIYFAFGYFGYKKRSSQQADEECVRKPSKQRCMISKLFD